MSLADIDMRCSVPKTFYLNFLASNNNDMISKLFQNYSMHHDRKVPKVLSKYI